MVCSISASEETTSGPWSFDFAGPKGVTLKYRGVPVVRQSTLYVVKPGWRGMLFDQRSQAFEVRRGEGGSVEATGRSDAFEARYSLRALDARRFRLRFEGRLLQDVPAEIEYGAAYFNANLIAHRPYRAQTASGPKQGTVAVLPGGSDQAANDLAPEFRVLEFESRVGPLKLEAKADQRVMFFDARRDPQDWAKASPVFWCGLGAPARKLIYGQPVTLELLFTVEDHGRPAHVVATLHPRYAAVKDAESGAERPYQVIPQPKRMVFDDPAERPAFHLSRGMRWRAWGVGAEDAARLEAALPLRPEAEAARIERRPGGEGPAGMRLLLARGDSARTSPVPVGGTWARHPEGYRLRIERDAVEILASTARGAFYGLQTLAQLVRPGERGETCPRVTVEDWPSLRFRGAHFFPSQSGVPFHRKLIERVLARYKLNAAVIQCEAARWDRHPEIAAPDSIRKADLQGLVDLAGRCYMEAVPLVNCPGHAEWAFRNGQNRDIVEDPRRPYAFCVNHPRTDAFIKDILTEAIEVFQPRLFHLGHDEVTLAGRFPNPECPRCAGKDVTHLVMEHANRLSTWLKTRSIEPVFWGDMFLAPQEGMSEAHAPGPAEAAERRKRLPKGTRIADWHYGPGERYPSLDLLKQAGLKTIASTWQDPLNVYHFSRAAVRAGSEGLLQTTWAGYFPNETILRDLGQTSAFILAAEYAWSGRPEPPSELGYSPGTVLTRAYFGKEGQVRPGTLVDLRGPGPDRRDWLGLGRGWDLAGLPSGRARFDDVLFDVPESLRVVGGLGRPAGTVDVLEVPVGGTFRQLALLNASVWAVPFGGKAARMIVDYADGGTEELLLETGRTTETWTSDRPAVSAPIGWQVRSPAGTPLTLRVTWWDNPHPERPVLQIRFEALDPEPGWVLAGLTLLDSRMQPQRQPGRQRGKEE